MRIKQIVAITAITLFSGMTAAEVYIGGTIGRSNHPYEDVNDDDASRLFIGYQLPSTDVAFEYSTIDMGSPRIDNLGDIAIDGKQASVLLSPASQAAGEFSLLFRLGYYQLDSELDVAFFGQASDDSSGIMWGIGGRYKITEGFSIIGEVAGYGNVSYIVDDETATVFDIGIQYNF